MEEHFYGHPVGQPSDHGADQRQGVEHFVHLDMENLYFNLGEVSKTVGLPLLINLVLSRLPVSLGSMESRPMVLGRNLLP